MKRKRRAKALLLMIAFFASLLAPSGVANAASIYDDVLWSQSSIWLPVYQPSTGTYAYRDVSTSWYSLIPDGAAKDSLDNARANGGHWAVANGNDTLRIIWSTDATVKTSFFMKYGLPSWGIASGNQWHITQLYEHSGVIYQSSYLSQTGDNVLLLGSRPDPLPVLPGGVVFSNYENVYPAGYDGNGQIPTNPPVAKSIFMGDSFASGEGNSPYEYGTDISSGSGKNVCHRSMQAYPRLLQSSLNLGPIAFVACSGATTANVLYGGASEGAWNEPPQVDALSGDTDDVVLSIGGNDAAFSSYLWGCVVACGPGTLLYSAMMDGIKALAFKENLKTTYETILEDAPNADIYVVDYPYMSANNAVTCGPFDFSGARNVQVALNGVIADAVNEVGNSRLHYVPTNYTGSPFTNRHLCTGEQGGAYFDITTMHPNPNGHIAYEDVIAAVY